MSDQAMEPDSPAYRDFRRVFFEKPHRDGPDVRVLDALSPAECHVAERQLIDGLDDPRVDMGAMSGLAYLRSRPAVGPLRKIMQGRGDRRAVHAAIALWRISEDEEAFETLCRAVRRRPWIRGDPARAHAAAVLRRIERPAALSPLIDALDDPDVAVRANARLAVAERLRLNAESDAVDSGQMSLAEFRAAARAVLKRLR